jgi:hypothetical protein
MTAAATQIGCHIDDVSAARTATLERIEANHGGWVGQIGQRASRGRQRCTDGDSRSVRNPLGRLIIPPCSVSRQVSKRGSWGQPSGGGCAGG